MLRNTSLVMPCGAFAVAVLCSFCVPHNCPGQDAHDLVKQARDKNRLAIDALHSISCRYQATKTYSYGRVESTPLTNYYRSGQTVRQVQTDGRMVREMLIRDGVLTTKSTTSRNGKNVTTASLSNYTMTRFNLTDLSEYCMFTFCGSKGDKSIEAGFDEWLNINSHKVASAERVTVAGRPHVKICIEFEHALRRTYWFDVNRNHLISKTLSEFFSSVDNEHQQITSEIQKFVSADGGLHFPQSIKITHANNSGKVHSSADVTIDNVRINQLIASNDLTIKFTPGTQIHNEITNKLCIVSSDGKIVETNEVIPQPGPPISAAAGPQKSAVYEKTVEREPLVNRILPYLSLVLLLGAGVVFFYRRRMQRKLEQE